MVDSAARADGAHDKVAGCVARVMGIAQMAVITREALKRARAVGALPLLRGGGDSVILGKGHTVCTATINK